MTAFIIFLLVIIAGIGFLAYQDRENILKLIFVDILDAVDTLEAALKSIESGAGKIEANVKDDILKVIDKLKQYL